MASQYRRAILWSTFIGYAGINWGMDTLVGQANQIQGTLLMASAALKRCDRGSLLPKRLRIHVRRQIHHQCKLAACIQHGIINWGCFGAFAAGYLAEKIGKRCALGIGCLVSIGAVFIQLFAGQPGTLLVGKVRRSNAVYRNSR